MTPTHLEVSYTVEVWNKPLILMTSLGQANVIKIYFKLSLMLR